MINFLHSYLPQPILLEIGWLKIHWYGFLIAIGALLGFSAVLYLAKQYKIKKEDIYNLAFYLVVFGLIGDRMYYVFYAWEFYKDNLLDIFKIWQGGLAIHGAMIAGFLVILIYSKKHKINPWLLADLVVVALAMAMAIGRWGNYFNMELYGKPTDWAIGIPILESNRPVQYPDNLYFHPTFLYESLWNLMIFVSLFVWHKLRLGRIKKIPGQQIRGLGNIFFTYLIMYSIGRFLNEFLRIDYSPYVFGIRWAQITSVIIILIAVGGLIYKNYYDKRSVKQSE